MHRKTIRMKIPGACTVGFRVFFVFPFPAFLYLFAFSSSLFFRSFLFYLPFFIFLLLSSFLTLLFYFFSLCSSPCFFSFSSPFIPFLFLFFFFVFFSFFAFFYPLFSLASSGAFLLMIWPDLIKIVKFAQNTQENG